MIIFESFILFLVIVPVLSTHKTLAAPNVSIIDLFLIMSPFLESLRELKAKKITSTIGSSSGTSAIAKVTELRRGLTKSPVEKYP